MRSSHNLGRATYVVVDPMTEEAHTGSSREQVSDSYTSSSSNTSRSAAPTRPPRARAIPVKRGKSLSQRVYGEKKDTQNAGKLRKRGVRSNGLGEIPNFNSVVDTLKSAQQTVQDTVNEIKADVERVQKTATYTAYGLLGFGIGVTAYLLFSDRR